MEGDLNIYSMIAYIRYSKVKINLLFCLLLFIIVNKPSAYAQGLTPIKINTVLVDWDNKQFKTEIPVGEKFNLKVYSKSVPVPTDLVFVRFLNTSNVFYYKQITMSLVGQPEVGVLLNDPVKITRKELIDNGTRNLKIEETKEYTDDPEAVYKHVTTYLVSSVEPNFSYALLEKGEYGKGVDDILKDKIISNNTTPIAPITNTEIENVNEKFVLPIVGVAYHPDQQFIIPFAGLRFSPFSPIGKKSLTRYSEMKTQSNFAFLKRVAFDVGISLASVEDPTQKRKNLFGSSSLLLGVSYPIAATGAFLSAGTNLFNYQEATATERAQIHSTYYLSLSFNIEVNPIFKAFGKLVGVE